MSRSEFFRQAATNFLGPSGEPEVERYIRGYSTHPEMADEVEAARGGVVENPCGHSDRKPTPFHLNI